MKTDAEIRLEAIYNFTSSTMAHIALWNLENEKIFNNPLIQGTFLHALAASVMYLTSQGLDFKKEASVAKLIKELESSGTVTSPFIKAIRETAESCYRDILRKESEESNG